MKKYYIEVIDLDENIVIQSKFYDTETEAMAFAEAIEVTGDYFQVDLMSAEWDPDGDFYTDIYQEKRIL